MDFSLGDIYTDANLLKEASQAADELLSADYRLEKPEISRLKKKLGDYMDAKLEKLSL